MSNILGYERIHWFHRRVKNRKYPNASTLSAQFELSVKTAQRAINFMRDRLGAPLEYDKKRKGYGYTDQSFEFPEFPVSQEEILSILIAKTLLSQTAGGILGRSINTFIQKVLRQTGDPGLSPHRLEEAFSALYTGYSPASPEAFNLTAKALLNHQVIAFDYRTPGTGALSNRQAEPHHLQHYMGSWVLIARCRLRNDWRKFYLSRMQNVRLRLPAFEPRPVREWDYLLDRSFGIFQSNEAVAVTLRFTPFRAGWIKEQFWHPKQAMIQHPDGSLDLTFPVSDFREIKMKILQFGADVEVLAPSELRLEVENEIQKMFGLYQK